MSHIHSHGTHRHVHREEDKKAVLNRIARAAGHLEKGEKYG